MSPKVLSIFNNAKIFLSDDEMKELQLCINTDLGKPVATKPATKKSNALEAWTVQSVTERLMASNYFNKKRV